MKKLIGTSLVLFLTSIPFVGFAQSYSPELQAAYNYAHSIGITTMSPIANANMMGNLIRSHMAKMMVEYAKNVLGKSANTSLSCNFTDVAGQSAELQRYIKEACQMGLMGVGISAFEPNGVVNRAQFGTVLSRALRSDLFDGATPYYKDHLQALKDAGIMTKIDTPNTNELRGWVMVMMMRIVGGDNSSSSICDTPENQFYCDLSNLLDLNICPSQCRPTTTTAGSLSVQKTSESYNVSDAIYLGSFQLNASNADIVLYTIKFALTFAGTPKIRLEKDGVRITPLTSPALDNTAQLTISNLQIPQGSGITLYILSDTPVSSINIPNRANISASATNVSASFPMVF